MDNWMNNRHFDGVRVNADLLEREMYFNRFLSYLGYERENRHFIETRENHEKIAMFCHAGFGNAMISYLLNIPLTLQWAGFGWLPRLCL